MAAVFPAVPSEYMRCAFPPSVLEKSEFKDDSQFFRFYADEEMEGTSSKSKQLQRHDFKLIENILAKSLVVSWHADTRFSPEQTWYCVILYALVTIGIFAFGSSVHFKFVFPPVL